ncbi:hypothetical protein L596_008040 [Steinernema carpocapsae]|uniref:Secreted protein n=1 Tax=Steinernema carpocapsae TaxID=34508 RepID=A0A4U5PCA5_STECR|nr:hypothetical protein L596_008040 [Steinernema carpocapsae]
MPIWCCLCVWPPMLASWQFGLQHFVCRSIVGPNAPLTHTRTDTPTTIVAQEEVTSQLLWPEQSSLAGRGAHAALSSPPRLRSLAARHSASFRQPATAALSLSRLGRRRREDEP